MAARRVCVFTIACLIIVGCDQRSVVEPGLPEVRALSDECARTCALTSDSRPFHHAAAKRDTAGLSTLIADIEVTGDPGASVLLRALSDPAFVSAGAAQLEVEIVDRFQRLTYPEVIKGAIIHRFEKPETIRIRYWIRNVVGGPVPQVGRLVQVLNEGASIRTALRPWVLRASPMANLDQDGRCYLTEPGSECGFEVNVIPTMYVGNGFGAFQNVQYGYGPSSPIRITFAAPVRELSVTVADPDFAGNSATITTPSGTSTQQFLHDGAPGVMTYDTALFSDSGITQLDLTPAPNDWVYYFEISFVPAPFIRVTCTPSNGVIRFTTTVTCTAAPSKSGMTAQINEWRFRGRAPFAYVQVTETLSTNTWAGPVAASGAISAHGTLSDGSTNSGSARVMTEYRRAFLDSLPDILKQEDSAADLPVRPDSVSKLGHVHVPVGTSAWLDFGWYDSLPKGGPGSGYLFFKKVPIRVLLTIHINRVALKESSAFWFNQRKNRQGTWCSRADVVPFVPVVEQHEGINWDQGSHTERFRAKLLQIAAVGMEPVVGRNDTELQAQGDTFASKLVKAAADSSDVADSFPPQYCNFQYFR